MENPGKLKIDRYFSSADGKVDERFNWGKFDVEIKKLSGERIYFAPGLEYPVDWSDQARKVVSSKFLYRGDGQEEKSLKSLVYRVSDAISQASIKQGLFSEEQAKIFRDELAYMEFNQMHSFNSPVWFNVGLHDKYGVRENRKQKHSSHWAIDNKGKITNNIDSYERPQASACFIQSIDDDMESILGHAKKEGMLFKFGSGTGTNYSSLRGVNEPLKGGGVASGTTSFMRVYDIIAGRIRSGGKTRRAAKMVILDSDHPDLYRFVHWKINEEKKALWLSSQPQWGPQDPQDLDTEAYKTVDGQNGNNSIRVTDNFMKAAIEGNDWDLWFRTAGRFKIEQEIPLSKYKDDRYLPDKRFVKKLTNKRKTINAGEALEQIARAAAVNGDPGLQYHDNINKWHTCPNSAPINASNPCSEYMFIDDSACNLASLNLIKFVPAKNSEEKILEIDSFESAVRDSIIAQEIFVDHASYPSEEIAKNSHLFRPLGLGYTNLGALLMSKGIAYDSEEGRAIASTVTSLMTALAYKTSAELARECGAFKEFKKNKEPMINVLRMHENYTKKINGIEKVDGLKEIHESAIKAWEEAIALGNEYGFRNSQVTLLAPTGTIGFMMDVDCTGVEPMIGLKTTKGFVGGGAISRTIAPSVTSGLEALGYRGNRLEKILDYAEENGSIVGAPELEKEHYSVFETAMGDDGNTINVEGHLNMLASVQPFLSGAISKTVNLPKDSNVEEVRETYIKGWKLGLKSVSLYIDGSKGIQPVMLDQKVKEQNGLKWGDRKKPPVQIERPGWKVNIGGTGIHFQVGEYNDRAPKNSPADYFVEFGSAGSPYSADITNWAKEASRSRQRGAPLEEFIKHNKGSSNPVNGFTDHPLIRTCSGIHDFFAKLIQLEYLGDMSVCDKEPSSEEIENLRCNVLARRRREEHYRSRIKFIEKVMEKGEVIKIYPLYEDEINNSEVPMTQEFCKECGHKTVPSGANCRKCPNCGDSGGCG
ncbi:MAG: vitamin B12-dependent ribonucleotide reductase [Nanoarchaeota archaeon]